MLSLPLEAWLGPFEPPSIALWGPFYLASFGLLAGLGFWVGMWVATRRAKSQFLDARVVPEAVLWLLVGALVGGHLGHALFYEPAHYWSNPVELLHVWDGLSSTGGFLMCTGLMIWFFRKKKGRFLPYGDVLAYAFPAGFFFGRLGCFSVSDHPGLLSEFPLAVKGIHPMPKVLCFENGVDYGGAELSPACQELVANTSLHDLGLYEALFVGGLFLVFLKLGKSPKPPGFFLGWLAVSYGFVRFFLDFLRSEYGPDVRYELAGLPALTPAQIFCVVLFGVGLMVLKRDWSLNLDAERVPKG